MDENLEYYLNEYQKIEDEYNMGLELFEAKKMELSKKREDIQEQIILLKRKIDYLINKRDNLSTKINSYDTTLYKKKKHQIELLKENDNTTYKVNIINYLNILLLELNLSYDDVNIDLSIDTDLVKGNFKTIDEYLNVLKEKYGDNYLERIPISLAVYLKDVNDFISIDWTTNINQELLDGNVLKKHLSLMKLGSEYTKLVYNGSIEDVDISFNLADLYLNKMSTLSNYQELIRDVLLKTLLNNGEKDKTNEYIK